jgi:NAD(P) transhydrogenase subunit alpha
MEAAAAIDPLIFRVTIFVLAIFVGYYVVWSVTPALHTPLMSVTNAISSVIIVGALIAAGPEEMNLSKIVGFIAVVLAAVNIFGGFTVTQRMLHMFRKKTEEGWRRCPQTSRPLPIWLPRSASSWR